MGLKVTSFLFNNVVFNNLPMDLEAKDEYGYPLSGNQDRQLYVPDRYETYKHQQNLFLRDHYAHNLKQIKMLLLDESFPENLILTEDEDKYSTYFEDCGREWLTWLVGIYKFQEAIPELREILLHDYSVEMREQAMTSIIKLEGEEVAKALCEKLNDKKEELSLRGEAAKGLIQHPYYFNIPFLRSAYEETEALIPINRISLDFEKFEGGWMPNYCLRAMGKIPTIDSLEEIKKALQHKREGINYNASLALDDWIKTSAQLILEKKFPGDANKRLSDIKKLIFKYNCKGHKNIYDKIRF